nr:MAG TPA: hypothetical protein [Caudoviricetes sp.]
MTNFERIKAMSVEEMADLLRGICPYTLCFISKSQKAEIERLKSANDKKFRQWDMLAEKSKQHYADLYSEAKDILKAEAYKEFAERLKEQFLNLQYNAKTNRKTVKIEELKEQMNWLLHTVAIETLDNLLKEMVGEEE